MFVVTSMPMNEADLAEQSRHKFMVVTMCVDDDIAAKDISTVVRFSSFNFI